MLPEVKPALAQPRTTSKKQRIWLYSHLYLSAEWFGEGIPAKQVFEADPNISQG